MLAAIGLGVLLSGGYALYSNSGPQWMFVPYTVWGTPVSETERVDPPDLSIPLRVPSAAAFLVSVKNVPGAKQDSEVVASGMFIMAGREIREDEIPDSLRREFWYRYRDIRRTTHLTPNGCIAFKDLAHKGGSIGLLVPYGLVSWQEGPPGTVWARLYGSPDSHYDVRARIENDHIKGTGQANLFGGSVFEHFEGQRLADAGLTDCFENALRLQKEGKGLPR